MISINNLSEISFIGKVVLAVINGYRAPCRKFLGELNQAIDVLENRINPAGGNYFVIQYSNEVNEVFHIRQMPCTIVMVDNIEKVRFSGHWIYHFEMANMISEGFSK